MRTRLQESVDAAVLTYGPRSSQTNLQADVQAQVAAAFQPGELPDLTVTVSTGTGILQASAAATVQRLMPIIGQPTIPISTSAVAKWGSQNIEVALVIDNTGSMSEALGGSTKISAVKTAASNFVSYLFANVVAPGTVKIALVPFDTDVNIGNANVPAQARALREDKPFHATV